MVLMQRRAKPQNDSPINLDHNRQKQTNDPWRICWVILLVFLLVLFFLTGQANDTTQVSTMGSSVIKITGKLFEIDTGIKIALDFDGIEEGDPSYVHTGPHKASLLLEKSCPKPGLWVRLEGDALIPVVLHEGAPVWTGSFTIPVQGNFDVVAYWYGCDGDSILKKRKFLTNVTTRDATLVTLGNQSLFPSSAWISSKHFTQAMDLEQPYVFHNPKIPVTDATLLKTSESTVSIESATQTETGFYQFRDLSNYELVCWIGSDSAALLFTSFLQLRPHISNHQRPFKFHLYESKSFQSPDQTWSDDNKKRFRKCKHILISMDEVETPLTQQTYIQHVTKFINHLLKAFPDETFPIWMFSVMESPARPTNCLEPSLSRSSQHPCNTALHGLFQNSPFPERVRYLDTTEITLPQLGENLKDVATAVALRIFVFVGKQVGEWRSNGQVGNVNGLKRGDIQEPNFELVPYNDWSN